MQSINCLRSLRLGKIYRGAVLKSAIQAPSARLSKTTKAAKVDGLAAVDNCGQFRETGPETAKAIGGRPWTTADILAA
jgi:hypothetical protein